MLHIQLFLLSSYQHPPNRRKFIWSRADLVQMVQTIQESGADNLWSFDLRGKLIHQDEGWQAVRVGWWDVARQPTLRGEWQIDLLGTSSKDVL
jgi:hypothetical protein